MIRTIKNRFMFMCYNKKIKQLIRDVIMKATQQIPYVLLSFGDQCECLEPPHVRKEMRHKAQNIAALYA